MISSEKPVFQGETEFRLTIGQSLEHAVHLLVAVALKELRLTQIRTYARYRTLVALSETGILVVDLQVGVHERRALRDVPHVQGLQGEPVANHIWKYIMVP